MAILGFLSGLLSKISLSHPREVAEEAAERSLRAAVEGATESPRVETTEQMIERLAADALRSDWQHRKVQALEQLQTLLPHERGLAYAFRLAENLQSSPCSGAVFDTTLKSVLAGVTAGRETEIKQLAFQCFDALIERREAFIRQHWEEEQSASVERLEALDRDVIKGAKFVVYEMTADVPPKIKAMTERAIQQMEEKYLKTGELSPYPVKVLFAECDLEGPEQPMAPGMPINLSEA